MAESAQTENKGSKALLYATIFLVITNIATLYLYFTAHQENVDLITNNTDLTTEKSALTLELEEMLAQYDSVSTDNEEMRAQVAEQKAQIEKLLAEAEKHKDDAYIIYKLRKEAATLRDVMKTYLVTIDSLNTLNQTLIAEKAEVKMELSNQKEENQQLNDFNEELAKKVEIGSKLKALDLVSVGQRVKNSTVHRETDRAKRVDKIKTCFTIDKNEVAKPGKKDIYLRIVDPNGEVLSFGQTEEYMFTYEDKEGLYSRKEEMMYENEELDMCLYWDVLKEPIEGTYIVEVYAEGYLIGTTDFELK
jgi:hypothetical protein